MGASLEGGELLVHLRFNQTHENYTVGGTRLDNGYLHLIEVLSSLDNVTSTESRLLKSLIIIYCLIIVQPLI